MFNAIVLRSSSDDCNMYNCTLYSTMYTDRFGEVFVAIQFVRPPLMRTSKNTKRVVCENRRMKKRK